MLWRLTEGIEWGRRRHRIPLEIALTSCLWLAACADQPMAPAGSVQPRFAAGGVAKFWETNASVYWNEIARELVAARANAFQAIRGYAIVSVAQYNAAAAAEARAADGAHPSVRAAVAAASAEALSYLFPADAAAIEDLLADFVDAPAWPGDRHTDAAAGIAVGRAAAQVIVARAQTDRFFTPWSGPVPTGPGLWFSTTNPPSPPVGVLFGQAKTYFLESGDQFRPPPPPAFGSAEFNSALAEVRQISDTRTAEQDAIAKFWAFPLGTYAPSGYWNEEAATLAVRYHLSERAAAHVFALANMVGFDAIVATHDAKFTYWLIRPTQADPGIRLAVGLPNFPSYPSNHAALSGGMASILSAAFPAERERLTALAEEAAMSRLFAGIHYRFDDDTGLALGRTIAAYAVSHDVHGHEPFVLDD